MNNFLELKQNEIDEIKGENYALKENITQLVEHIKNKLAKYMGSNDASKLIKSQYEEYLNIINKNKKNKNNKDKNNKDEYEIRNMNTICDNIHFNGNLPEQKHGDIQNKTSPFGDADNTIPTNGYQYVIGRITTLKDINIIVQTNNNNNVDLYKTQNIRILYLDEKEHEKQWSIFINDLFIYCSVIYDKYKYIDPKTESQIDQTKPKFAIRLIYDKESCNEARQTDNKSDLQRICVGSALDLKTPYDVVTLREIEILAYVFGLKCYKYTLNNMNYNYVDKDKYETFFFTYEDIMTTGYENITDKVMTFVNKKIQKGGYYYKYLKYKNKYNNLKKK
jgi:hypothetical protein